MWEARSQLADCITNTASLTTTSMKGETIMFEVLHHLVLAALAFAVPIVGGAVVVVQWMLGDD